MIKTINQTQYEIMAFDLENTVDPESVKNNETRMWLGCLIGEDDKLGDDVFYYDIADFVDKLEELTKPIGRSNKHKNLMIYIWNLAHEWSFILPELVRRGLKPGQISPRKGKAGKSYEAVTNKSVSSVWTAGIKFNSNGGIIRFRDLAKLLGGSLKNAAKSLKTETQKGDDEGDLIDYEAPRPKGYIPTELEKEYNYNDCRIIIEILQKINNTEDKYFWKSLSAASWSASTFIGETYKKYKKPMAQYRKDYPQLYDKENDFIRKTIKGGICYATPYHQGENIKTPVFHIDAHQMHPSQMYYKFFPYGHGKYFKGEPPKDMINAVHVRVSYSGVKLHSNINCLNRGTFFADGLELWLWDFEIPTMYKCYEDLEIEYIDGYSYKMKRLPWRLLLAENYNNRLKCKLAGDDYGQKRFKLLNNSFYGKLLENSKDKTIVDVINEKGIIDTIELSKDSESNCGKYAYIPVGSCIPAYSRVALVETALLFDYRDVIYFDTDSIFVMYNDNTRKVWESNKINKTNFFGGWGLEGENGLHYGMRAVCAKRYITTDSKGNKDVKCAGMGVEEFFKQVAIDKHYLEKNERNNRKIVEGVQKFLKENDIANIKMDGVYIQVRQRTKAKGGTIIKTVNKYIKKTPTMEDYM